MRTYLKNKRVLGVLIGTLVIIGLLGITPRLLHSQNTQGSGSTGGVLLFHGYAYDINGNPKSAGSLVYATKVGNPEASISGSVINDNGEYYIYGHTTNLGEQYYLNYAPHATSGTGPVTAPAEVNIIPSQW